MPLSLMPSIKSYNVSGENFSHTPKNGTIARSNKQMEMVGNKGPSIDLQGFSLALLSQTNQEVIAVLIRAKYVGSFDAPRHHMM
jgi:hypothetical protein